MTIRARLSLLYSGALVVTIAILGVLVWLQLAVALKASLVEELQVQVADVRGGMQRAGEAVIHLDPARPTVFTAIFDAGGRLETATRNFPAGLIAPPAGTSTQLGSGNTMYQLYAAVGPNRDEIAAGASLVEVDRPLASLARLLVAIGAGAGVLSLIGGWWLAGRALGPMVSLTQAADAIAVTDLDHRLVTPVANDEIGRLAQTVNRMLDRVADAVRREHAFIAAASHDLRTPIATLRTELELAERSGAGTADLLEAIRAAHADAVRLGDLTSDLLTLAEAEPTGRQLLAQSVRIDELLDGALRRVRPIARERSIDIAVTASPTDVIVDRIRIEQAVVNLLTNAIREAPAASTVEVEAEVSIRGETSERWLSVRVLDRGPGVPSELRSTLFVPFAAKAGRRVSGTGLGLATAAMAVHAHHGEIGYDDRPGGGAAFWFTLPC